MATTKKKLVEPSKTPQASTTTNSNQSKPTTPAATTTTSKNTTESKNGTKSSSAPQQSEKVVEKSNKTTTTTISAEASNKKNSAKNNSSSNNNTASNSSSNNSKPPANTTQSTTTVNSNPPVVVADSGSSKKKNKKQPSSSSDTTNTITTATTATPIVSTTVQSNKKNNSVTTNSATNTSNNIQSKNSVALVTNTTPISANSSSNIENVSTSKKKNKKNKSSQPEESQSTPSNNGTVTKNETNSVTTNPTTVSNDIAVTAVQPTSIVKEKKTHNPGKDDNSLSAWLCRAYFAIGLLIAWNVCFIIVLPMYICHILFGFDKNKSLMGWMFRYTNRCVVETNPFWNIKTFYANGSTKNRLPKKQKKVIFICNHQSGMDPFILISALPIEAKWVAKHIIFKIPIAGWLMTMIGDVPIVFTSKKAEHTTTDKGSVNRALDTLRNYLNNDCAVFFFPEGRRSENPDEFLEFRKGAFVMALQTGADIVPIAISGSHTIWELKHKLPRPGRCAMVVGDPISVKGMTLENDVDNLLQKSRKAVEDLYQIAKKKAKNLK